MGALLHDRPGRADRGPGRTQPGDGAAAAVAPVHDRRVQLDMAVIGQHASSPGVEAGILFQDARRRLDRVERVATRRQDRLARIERGAKPRSAQLVQFLRKAARPHRPGPAVNDQFPAH